MTADTQFKIGDRVRVRAVATLARADHGRTGVIDTVYPGTPYPYGVIHDDNGGSPVYSADELENASNQPAPAGSTPSTTPLPHADDREPGRVPALAALCGPTTGRDLDHAKHGERVRIVAGWHAGTHGTVELGPDDLTSNGHVWVRVDGSTSTLPYAPGELERIGYVPETGRAGPQSRPRPDDVVSAAVERTAAAFGTALPSDQADAVRGHQHGGARWEARERRAFILSLALRIVRAFADGGGGR